MKLGFIIPNFPDEKRVALLPNDIIDFPDELVIEEGFGSNMDIEDEEYIKKGCQIADRKTIFEQCDSIFCLKLMQESDYRYLRKGQTVIGWVHPYASGKEYFEKVCIPKDIKIVDLDNITPRIFYKDIIKNIDFIKRDFVIKNSYLAGYSATLHAIMQHGVMLSKDIKIAILSSGNVAQGAFNVTAKLGGDARMFYRKTMNEFKEDLETFDIIINGIEVDKLDLHIISLEEQKRLKKGCLIIDAAADAGNAIEGTHYTSIGNPIYKENGLYYYVVNNAPSIMYRVASTEISKSFSHNIYSRGTQAFLDLINM